LHYTPETQVKTPFSKPFSIGRAGRNTPTNLRCFDCNQLDHTRKLCPNRVLGNASNTSRNVVTSARVQTYAIGNTNSVTPVTSDSCVDKGGQVQSPAAQSSVGEWRVHGKNDNCHSIRDVIDPHDERASELVSEVTATRPENSVVGSPAGNVRLSTRSTAVGPESSDAHSSVTTTRNNRGNSGSRIFYASNVDSHATHNVCSTSVISDSILSPQSIADNIATLKYVRVSIYGVDNNIDALNDSGSRIIIIHRSIIPDDILLVVSLSGLSVLQYKRMSPCYRSNPLSPIIMRSI